jgi:demethylmenaquinone methyltransferase/2-methoxy-6-polyprenyl-1,4-benzoquinol methylase
VSDEDLVADQIAYYRARAGEYDATSTPEGDPFAGHDAAIRERIAPLVHGSVLELAAGTGQWSGMLADHADELLVTDASPEMLELNRAKLAERSNVRYHLADALALHAARTYDVVFFGFFLSHVPPGRFDGFWGSLAPLLSLGGLVLFVDEGRHFLWREDWIDEEAGIARRQLTDGTSHRVVKVLWRANDLERRLDALGWDTDITTEGPFYAGIARPAESPRRPDGLPAQ